MHRASGAGPSTLSNIPTSANLGTICRDAVLALAGRYGIRGGVLPPTSTGSGNGRRPGLPWRRLT